MIRACLRLLLLALLLLPAGTPAWADDDAVRRPVQAPDAPLNERVLTLPGDPQRPVTLEVTLFTPDGPGPYPLAVLNHGATFASAHSRGDRYRYTFSAYYFLSRGYAVALPMMRGFADSGGEIVHAGCALDDVGRQNAQDLRAVIGALAHLPGTDPTRIIVAGQSFGAWNSLALATMPVAGVRGVIAFSPALRASDCDAQDQAMIDGASSFGAAARVPSLWFYGDNDAVMPVPTWRAVVAAYRAGGGQAELVPVGRIMQDSHQMLSFPESLPLWTPRVDAFLARLGLPSAELYPHYLPIPTPSPSHFAALDDVEAVPLLNDKGRGLYSRFLSRPLPRVFALSANGDVSATDGGFDPLARALRACSKAGLVCRPYAIDKDVVWTGAQSPLVYNRVAPAGGLSVLDFAFAVNPDCSARGVPRLWVTQAPGHGIATILSAHGHPHFAPGNPLAACDATMVPGTAVTYRPAPGYSGPDTIGFEETDVDGHDHRFRVALTVR